MRAIDADRLLTDRMKEHYYHLPNGDIAIPIIDIEHAPTIVPERKRGRWMPHEDEDGEHYGDKCSVCGEWYVMPYGKTNFCPNCGAYMGGEKRVND